MQNKKIIKLSKHAVFCYFIGYAPKIFNFYQFLEISMEAQKIKVPTQSINLNDEKILVVKQKNLFQQPAFNGFLPLEKFTNYLEIIKKHKEFMWRSEMELDPSYKQIIPYIVFKFDNQVFLMQRKSTASESRLKNKYSLGIGGHIRQEDIIGDDIFEWARREFIEEVNYNGKITIKPLGLVNDDSTEVGKVHFGFIIMLTGDSVAISVKSELKDGSLLTLQECEKYYLNMETWSQLVFDYLKTGNL